MAPAGVGRRHGQAANKAIAGKDTARTRSQRMRKLWLSMAFPAQRQPGRELKYRLNLQCREMTWEAAAASLMKCRPYRDKGLDAPHWFAGQMNREAEEAGYVAMLSREFLVVDHDQGKLSMAQASKALAGLAHVIIPSSQWQPGYQRFHAVLPLAQPVPMAGDALKGRKNVELWHSLVDTQVSPWLDARFGQWGGRAAFDNNKNGVRRYYCYGLLASERGGLPLAQPGDWLSLDWQAALRALQERRYGVQAPPQSLAEAAKGYEVGSVLSALIRAPEGLAVRHAILSLLVTDCMGAAVSGHTRAGAGGDVFYNLPCPRCRERSVWTPTAVERRVPLARCNHGRTCGYTRDIDIYLVDVVSMEGDYVKMQGVLERARRLIERRR